MNIDKTTCWYPNGYVYGNMISAIRKHKSLSETGHGKVLIDLLNTVDSKDSKVLDLGCGGALLHTVVKGNYTGADMEHMINNVSMKCFDNLNYIKVDVVNDDISFIKNYDLVVMNALIDVMQHPIYILNKILESSSNYVIVHRQEIISDDETRVIKNPSYGGLTYHSLINIDDFNNIVKNNGFNILKNVYAGVDVSTWRSILLKKNDTI